VIYAATKLSIDSPGVHDASSRFEESKYLVLGDRSKLKNPVDESKERIQDGSNLLTAQVNATSYGRVSEQPVDLAKHSTFIYYVTLKPTIYIFRFFDTISDWGEK
jgi:hypothetical protein